MKQFPSIQKLDTGILYTLELTSSISVLLLAFGLIASMVNVLTKGAILTGNTFLQEVWAWTQCIAIDANVAGSIIRTYAYYREGEWLKMWLYGLLSAVLLFTAAIVSNIESVQQTLNITLASAYTHVFVPIELLIWIRSVAIVLIIVAHAARHVGGNKTTGAIQAVAQSTNGLNVQVAVQNQTILVEKPQAEQVSVQELPQEQKALSAPARQKGKAEENRERVRAYLLDHPGAKAQELATELSLSLPTVRKYMKEV